MRGKKIEKLNDARQFIVLITIGLLFFFFVRTSFFQSVWGTFQTVSVPIQASFNQTTKNVGSFFQTIFEIGNLRKNNSDLSIDNAKLIAENQKLRVLQKENESLRNQIGSPANGLKTIAAAHPIGNGAVGVKSVLLIDQGTDNKVQNGDLVTVGNILVGQIVNVSSKISSVQLLSDPDTKIPAITAGGAEGIIQGQFGSGIKLTDVVQEKVLNVDELVLTSGRNSWPKGMVLGKITKVNKVEKDFFQTADIVSTVDINSLSLVYVARY